MRCFYLAIVLMVGCQVEPPVDASKFTCPLGTCEVAIEPNIVGDHHVRLAATGITVDCFDRRCAYEIPARRELVLSVVPARDVRWYEDGVDLGMASTATITVDGPLNISVDFEPVPDTYDPSAPHVLLLIDSSASMQVEAVQGDCPFDRQANGLPDTTQPMSRTAAVRAALNGCKSAGDGALSRYPSINIGVINVGPTPKVLAPLGSTTDRLEAAVRTIAPTRMFAINEGIDVAARHADGLVEERTGATDSRVRFLLIADGVDTGSPDGQIYRWACNGAAAAVQPGDVAGSTPLLIRYLGLHDTLCDFPGDQRIAFDVISLADTTRPFQSAAIDTGGDYFHARTVDAIAQGIDYVMTPLLR